MSVRALAVVACLLLGSPAWAASDDIPENLQGKWADQGKACDHTGRPVVISATTLVYSDGKLDDVFFTPGEGSNGVIHLVGEGLVASYDYFEATDTLVFHPEGLGTGSALPMARCQERTSILERRCGWLTNLTPGNWWLVDGDRTWVLSAQGESSVAVNTVMDMVPLFDPEQYVSTGTDYGYGCTCMTVTTDGAQDRILGIASSKREPLARCQADPSLPAIIE